MFDLSSIELVRDALLQFASEAREANMHSALMADDLALRAQALRHSPMRFRADKRAKLKTEFDDLLIDVQSLATSLR